MDELTKFLNALKEKLNEKLKGLPPIEQFEATSQIACALRDVQWSASYLMDSFADIEARVTSLLSQVTEQAKASVKAELLSSGEFIAKADAEAAAHSARKAGADDERTRIQAEAETANKAKQRREEIIQGGVPRVAAELLTDAQLAAEDYQVHVDRVKGRAQKVAELGIPTEAHDTLVRELASLPYDETGDEAVDARIKLITTIAGGTAKSGSRSRSPLSVPPSESGVKYAI